MKKSLNLFKGQNCTSLRLLCNTRIFQHKLASKSNNRIPKASMKSQKKSVWPYYFTNLVQMLFLFLGSKFMPQHQPAGSDQSI